MINAVEALCIGWKVIELTDEVDAVGVFTAIEEALDEVEVVLVLLSL
ncbi:hypothetical protein AGMMS49950_00240 [Endomicrobiia bacterium]|nr:hypothetical protein AGMMS49531_00800 [Endomicrobiia bacterium]GHT68761.1 hypothetical protein AGMMS49950_00160 [Endomicrobiia bacterium]GHT68784.1 hypothetical protein AGMMS49950_00240 [Endomicrobiia bacterium]